jgi:hypothetical protein
MINDPIIRMIPDDYYEKMKEKMKGQKRYYGLIIPYDFGRTLTSFDIELLQSIPIDLLKDVSESLNMKPIMVTNGLNNNSFTIKRGLNFLNNLQICQIVEENFNG